jgi:hypothetical protein
MYLQDDVSPLCICEIINKSHPAVSTLPNNPNPIWRWLMRLSVYPFDVKGDMERRRKNPYAGPQVPA